MREEPSDTFEKGPEAIPTPEEVQSVFEQLIGGKGYETLRQREDEQGLYLFDIIVSGEDGDIEYLYRRGRSSEKEILDFRIDVIFLDEAGIPVSGETVARYIDGKWKLLS